MNFLAHIYLSGENPDLKIGNFIADSIKGKSYVIYPETVQKGILLHRKIDYYTDTHPVVRKSIQRLSSTYGHYSGVIIDLFYDHYLASLWNQYHPVDLATYIQSFYKLLQENFDQLPKRIQNFLPYMIRDNWLLSYATIPGMGRIMYQMNHRTKNRSKMNFAVIELEKYYTDFKQEFILFFEDLRLFVAKEIENSNA